MTRQAEVGSSKHCSPSIPGGRLRMARPDDATRLWEWANDLETRRHAFHPEPIPWESHAAWYAAKLADPRCLIAILEMSDGSPVGQVRFDHGSDGLEIDISVANSRRGQGIGQALLAQGLEAAARRWPQGTKVVAKVLAGNARSCRLFEQCGFVLKGVRTFQGTPFHQFERLLSQDHVAHSG